MIDRIMALVKKQIEDSRLREQRLRLELSEASRSRDSAKREVQAYSEEVRLREDQMKELQQSKRDLISAEGGGLAQSLADTYESVMSEEFRVMKAAFEAKVRG